MTFRLKKQHLLALLPESLVQTRGPRRQAGALLLSFDDGPHPEHTPRLLDLLATHGARASFFVVGERAERQPALLRRIVAEGHLLGNHSWSHNRFARLPLAAQVAELDRTDALLAGFDQCRTHRIRPPQGHLSLPLLLHFACHRRSVAYWSYDSLDYQPQPLPALIERLRAAPPRAGDIVLMHDDDARAGAALASLLPQWRDAGHSFIAMAPERA